MAPWVKALAKPDDLSSIPETRVVGGNYCPR